MNEAHFTSMTDQQRFNYTVELWMLWQMRYRIGGPLVENYTRIGNPVVAREIWLAEQLGFRHSQQN